LAAMSVVSRPTLWLVNTPVSQEQSLATALSYSLLFYHTRLLEKPTEF